MSAITKPEWRRRCIAHLRAHCGEDLREYKVARRSAASIEEDQAERFMAALTRPPSPSACAR